MDLTTVFEDEYILVVDKPSGLLSVPGRGPEKADCVVARAARRFPGIREVHRLDQPTSGLLMLAKNPEVHRRLSMAFSEHRVTKIYVALAASVPKEPGLPGVEFLAAGIGPDGMPSRGRISLFQHLDIDNRPMQVVVPGPPGRQAVTEWIPGEVSGGVSRLELHPRSGRTHQLRLALATCGAPIIGDSLYAPDRIAQAAPRLMLHAVQLVFEHPMSGEAMEVTSEPGF